mgnify:CR=1 FL=1
MLIKFNAQNIYHLYARRGIICLLLAGTSFLIPFFGIAMAIAFLVAFVQFMHTAAKRLSPLDEPYFVRQSNNLERWWKRFSEPLDPGYHAGHKVYTRGYYDYREIFDLTGRMIGIDQTTEWSASDMEWNPGDPEDTVVRFKPVQKMEQPQNASWLAMLRSPKHVSGMENVHPITHLLNGRIDGHTTYLTMLAA